MYASNGLSTHPLVEEAASPRSPPGSKGRTEGGRAGTPVAGKKTLYDLTGRRGRLWQQAEAPAPREEDDCDERGRAPAGRNSNETLAEVC